MFLLFSVNKDCRICDVLTEMSRNQDFFFLKLPSHSLLQKFQKVS